MKHSDFQRLAIGDRVTVKVFAITGRKPSIDEETGEPCTRPIMRQKGTAHGVVIARNDSEFVTVRYDEPQADINDVRRRQRD